MPHKHHVCESCFKICEEAKSNLKKLQKKVYILTIVCTSAITLLGEQGGKALLSSLNTVNSAMNAAEGKETTKDLKKHDTEKIEKIHPIKDAWVPAKNKFFSDNFKKELIKKYESTDELARFTKKEETPVSVIEPKISQSLLKIPTNNLQLEIQTPIQDSINVNISQIPDNFSIFFTPSLLPFDVYSTTLALGNNYGFGDYYGINPEQYTYVPQPGSFLLSSLAFIILSNRTRN